MSIPPPISLGHPLCVHLTRNLQGADKNDHLSIEDNDKGQRVEDIKKNQLLLIIILLLIFFFVFLQPHPVPSLPPAGFLAICTFPSGSRACPCWDVGGWGGGKASQGLVLFLNSSACQIWMVHFWCSDNPRILDATSTLDESSSSVSLDNLHEIRARWPSKPGQTLSWRGQTLRIRCCCRRCLKVTSPRRQCPLVLNCTSLRAVTCCTYGSTSWHLLKIKPEFFKK